VKLWLVQVRAPRLDTAKASGKEVRVVGFKYVHYRYDMRAQGTGWLGVRRPTWFTPAETAKNGKRTDRKEREEKREV